MLEEKFRITHRNEVCYHLENSNGLIIYPQDLSFRSIAIALKDVCKRHAVVFAIEENKSTLKIKYRLVGYGSMTSSDIVGYFQYRGLRAVVKNEKNKHIQVTGPERIVDYYGTNCTVYSRPQGKYKYYRLKESTEERALERVVGLANAGY